MKLYGYFRSSTAYRTRIALNLKGLPYEQQSVSLIKGEQHSDDYKRLNPMQAVPTLVHDGKVLTQSLAIMEYLDDIKPEPALVYGDALQKAYIRQISYIISTDIHPVTNLRILKALAADFGADDQKKNEWYARWALMGMQAVEAVLREGGRVGAYACGDSVSMADLCIVPQMYNMRRYQLPLADLPLCCRIEENCRQLEAFRLAAPENQEDSPPDLERIHG